MRVLMITDWPKLEAGTERYVELVRDELMAAGDDVRLLTGSTGSAARGSADYVARTSDRLAAQAFLQLANPSAVCQIRRALREFAPDVVQLNMFLQHLSPAVLMSLRRVPTLLVVHDYKAICPRSTKLLPDGSRCTSRAGSACMKEGCVSIPRLARDLPRYGLLAAGLRGVDGICTVSEWMRGELARSGIEADLLTLPVRPPRRAFRRRPAPDPLFVYGGRLAPVKGVDLLMRAFRRLVARQPRARLRIVGDGPEQDRLRALAGELGIAERVDFRLVMSPAWTEALEDAWALVAPSVYAEPLGLVAIEALVHGVPVVASDAGGFAETVERGAGGLLFRSGDEHELAAALDAVARGAAFAGHSVTDRVRRETRLRHDPAGRVGDLRARLGALAAA